MKTKERILRSALKLFNEQGIGSVTARLISKDLGISGGTFSYHFPNKGKGEDNNHSKKLIIHSLYQAMLEEMKETFLGLSTQKASILVYLDMHRKIFEIQVRYKFFYLNLFEILSLYPDIKADFQANLENELKMGSAMVHLYVQKGVLKSDIEGKTLQRLINVGRILYNFWTLDAAIMPPMHKQDQLIHYLNICCGLLEPYLEEGALKEYKAYFAELERAKVPHI